eukprot:5176477-Heterocapsa_arctica.AAC.1
MEQFRICDQDRIAYSNTAAAATVRSVKVSVLLTKCFTNAIEHHGNVYGCRWAIGSAMGNCNPCRANHKSPGSPWCTT